MTPKILLILSVVSYVMAAATYKPVVVIHGVNDTPQRLKYFSDVIKTNHPGTNVTIIDSYNGKFSLMPMWTQVGHIKKIISKICDQSPQGIHLIGYSQGGLIARGIIQTLDNHNIDTFISLVGPQNGQFGETDQKGWIPKYYWVKEHLYWFLYTAFGQLISVGGYWKDPHHIDMYCRKCYYLPVINNRINHTKTEEFKTNFLKLKKVVFIASNSDTTITPWQSSRFGFYDEHENVVEMHEQETYKNDSFGLRTLDERGDLVIDTISGLDHQDLPDNATFIENHILPWLT